ncbi:hypothetical protein AgCh_023779 [Apium graveolens]
MLTLVIGFDPKSATAISKRMIMGAAVSTVYYNLKLRHPTIDKPIIDYDLEAAKHREDNGNGGDGADYKLLPGGPDQKSENGTNSSLKEEFGLLCFVWVAYLAVQITKNYTTNCSTEYWVLNFLQVPVSVGVSLYEAISLYTGRRVIASNGESGTNVRASQLFVYCSFSVLAGVVGGLLGLGGGFIMGPLFLEFGIPPQVTSATATFGMMFSSSMSVVEYYLLNRFPVPYALYFILVAAIAAFVGQDVVTRVVSILGRASIIIFILYGGVGVVNMIGKIQRHEYMGFENHCQYGV